MGDGHADWWFWNRHYGIDLLQNPTIMGESQCTTVFSSPSLVVMLILFGSQQCSIRNTAGESNKFQIGLGGCALYVLILIERDEHE